MKKEWLETAGTIIIAFAAYNISILFFLFLIPLHMLYFRRGQNNLLIASAFVFAGIVIAAFFRTSVIVDTDLRFTLIILESAFPFLLILGMFIINGAITGIEKKIYRAIAAAVITGLASIPIIIYMRGNEQLAILIDQQIELITDIIRTGFSGEGSFESSLIMGYLNAEEMAEMMQELIYKNYLFAIFILITGSWWVSANIYKRIEKKEPYHIENFILPEVLIWPLLISWSGILLDAFFGIGVFGYFFWNAGLIMLFLYGLHGFGIIRFFFRKRRISRGRIFLFGLFLIILLLWPGINLIVIIGIPGLGLSELWIKYRKVKEEN